MRNPARAALLVAAVAVSAVFGAACGSEEQDPAEARRERVEARLRSSFSARQANCIVEQLDGTVLRALDRKADLEADSPAMVQFSAALEVCVTGGGTTTTTAPGSGDDGPTVTTTTR